MYQHWSERGLVLGDFLFRLLPLLLDIDTACSAATVAWSPASCSCRFVEASAVFSACLQRCRNKRVTTGLAFRFCFSLSRSRSCKFQLGPQLCCEAVLACLPVTLLALLLLLLFKLRHHHGWVHNHGHWVIVRRPADSQDIAVLTVLGVSTAQIVSARPVNHLGRHEGHRHDGWMSHPDQRAEAGSSLTLPLCLSLSLGHEWVHEMMNTHRMRSGYGLTSLTVATGDRRE